MKEAVDAIEDYQYRKEFGLSAEEFYYEEPYDVYVTNLHIMNTINQIHHDEAKSMKRKGMK